MKYNYNQSLQTGRLFLQHNGVDVYHVTKCGAPQMYWYALGDIRKVGDFDVRSLKAYAGSALSKSWSLYNVKALIVDAIDAGEVRATVEA
jgi:hypothetical protein